MRVLVLVMAFFTNSVKKAGFLRNGLPAQPLFELFGIYNGVYCGAIKMHKNTDWEMHPDGDETLTLLSGRIQLVLQDEDEERRIILTPGRSAVIPAGIWHRQIVETSGELLFMTFGDTPTAQACANRQGFRDLRHAQYRSPGNY